MYIHNNFISNIFDEVGLTSTYIAIGQYTSLLGIYILSSSQNLDTHYINVYRI